MPTSQPCPTCNGSGAKPGTSPKVCPVCNGRGVEAQSQGIFSMSQPCSNCHGSGTVIEDPCPTCDGTGAQRSVRRLRVNIPAGVRDGSRIRLAGKGEPGLRGAEPGDLYVITRVSESPVFKRNGDNLEVEVPLTIPEAIRGAVIEVPTLNGSKRLRVPAGTKHGTVQRLRGEGPPRLGGKGRGDIRYRFVIDVPASLSAEQSEAVDRLAEVMNGNPRERLFAEAGARGELQAEREGGVMARRVRTTTRVEVSSDRGVFMISVAAELAEMHPADAAHVRGRGLIEPKRSPKGTRLYSQEDVERLRRIQEMTAELGMNLAGVERVFELEQQLEAMSRKVAALEKRAAQLDAEVERLEALRRELRAEIVPYERGGELVRSCRPAPVAPPAADAPPRGECATIARTRSGARPGRPEPDGAAGAPRQDKGVDTSMRITSRFPASAVAFAAVLAALTLWAPAALAAGPKASADSRRLRPGAEAA